MLAVDRQHFDRARLLDKHSELGRLHPLRNCRDKLFAICLKHPFDVVSTVTFLKEHGGGALLLHDSTPRDRAMEAARQAGADYLLFGNPDEPEPVQNTERSGNRRPGVYQYSSGTTGQPKLIARTWEAVDAEIRSYNARMGLDGRESPLILVPVSHSFGLITGVLASFARGAVPHVVTDRNPRAALRLIREAPDSLVYAVPFLLHLLLQLGNAEVRFHRVISSGAPLTEELLGRLKRVAAELWQQYGCSELGCISLGANPATPADAGKPLPHLEVVCEPIDGIDPRGEPLQEIVATAGQTSVRTRDIGYLSESGTLFVTDRLDDMINVSGLKVLPSEIEAVIGRIEGVREAVVYKTKHKVWGEAVKAMVAASPEVSEQEIRAACLRMLPGYKVPSDIQLVPEIPKLPSGKISRKLLIEQESMP